MRSARFSAYAKLVLLVPYIGLSGGKAGYRHTIRRAGYIVKTYAMAEIDTGRIAAMFAADAQMDIRTGRTAKLGSHFY